MRFIVNSQVLLKNLQTIGGVVSNNSTLPILNNFLFVLKDSALTVTASDLETTMSVKIELTEASEDGAVAIPAKIILDTLKTFADIPVLFQVNNENFSIEISAGEGRYKLAGENADGYPTSPMAESTTRMVLDSTMLNNAINYTILATGNDELRPVMSGVYFEMSENSVRFVATDAHKLVRYTRTDVKADNAASFIVPKKPLNQLRTILGTKKEPAEVVMEFNEKNTFFTFDNLQIICRLIDGKYPNYEAVIPKNNPNKLIVDRLNFLTSIRRVSLFSSQSTPQVRLKISGQELIISAEDMDYNNEAKEKFACQYEGEPIEIGFNSKFLMEMLNNVETAEICLEMSVPTRAGIILPVGKENDAEDILMLVMPIMLN